MDVMLRQNRAGFRKLKLRRHAMKIMQNRMDRGFQRYQKEYEKKALEVLRSGWYILGKELEDFESDFSE